MNAFVSVATVSWLLEELARTTLLVAIVGLVAWLLLRTARVQSPTLHRVCCCFVLLAGWTFVRWPVEVPWYEPPRVEVAENPVADGAALPPIAPALLSPPGDLAAGNSFSAIVPETTPPVPLPNVEAPNASPLPRFSWPQLALATWLAGIAAIVAAWCFGYARFLVHLPAEVPADSQWRDELAALQAEQGGRRVELRVTEQTGPLLCRLPRGAVLLVPCQLWAMLDVDDRRAILLHELAHYQRGDLWKSLALRVLALPHWFNPIVWLALRRFDEAAEWACDRAAMGDEPTAYARLLLRIGELVSVPARFGSAMSNRPLTTRIRRLLTLQSTEDSAMKKAILLSCLLLVAPLALVRVSLVAQQPVAEASEAKPTGPSQAAPSQVEAATETSAKPEGEPAALKTAELKMVEAAHKAFIATNAAYQSGTTTLDPLVAWSTRWLSAQLAIASTRDEQIAAARANLERIQRLHEGISALYKTGNRGGEAQQMETINYYLADAERRLAEVEGSPTEAANAERPVGSKARSARSSARPIFAVSPVPAGARDRKHLYDGKTFAQWLEQLEIELSHGRRKEAMYAMAEFAVHGYGKEVAWVVFDVAREFPEHTNNSLVRELEEATLYASTQILPQDLLPFVTKALGSDNVAERRFAIQTVPTDSPPRPEMIALLVAALNDSDPQVAAQARSLLASADPENPQLKSWLQAAFAGNDTKAMFAALPLVLESNWKTPLGRGISYQPQTEFLPNVVALVDHPDEKLADHVAFQLRQANRAASRAAKSQFYDALVKYIQSISPAASPKAVALLQRLKGE